MCQMPAVLSAPFGEPAANLNHFRLDSDQDTESLVFLGLDGRGADQCETQHLSAQEAGTSAHCALRRANRKVTTPTMKPASAAGLLPTD